jgi:AcrR family transcriptional regulator
LNDLAGLRPLGRPRSPALDEALLEATLEEYAARGFDRLSIEAVAARAGSGKAAIYRRYGSKLALVAAAMYRSGDRKPTPDEGSIEADLRVLTDHLHDLVNDPTLGACLRHMAADAPANPELAAVHDAFVQDRRAGTKLVLQRGIDRGELRADLDLELACDLLTGPVFLRHLMSHMPVDLPYLEHLRSEFLRLYLTN